MKNQDTEFFQKFFFSVPDPQMFVQGIAACTLN